MKYTKLKQEQRLKSWERYPLSMDDKLDYAVECNLKNITKEEFRDTTGETFDIFVKNNNKIFVRASKLYAEIKKVNKKLTKILVEGCGCKFSKLCKIHTLFIK